jgi:hypothetical protein
MFNPDVRVIPAQPPKAGFAAGPAKLDAIRSVKLSLAYLPLARQIANPKENAGLRTPSSEDAFVICE